jgi:septum formation protein
MSIPKTIHRLSVVDKCGENRSRLFILIYNIYKSYSYKETNQKFTHNANAGWLWKACSPKPRDKFMHSGISLPGVLPMSSLPASIAHFGPNRPSHPQEQSTDIHSFPMTLILASTSPIRLQLLRSAGLTVETHAPRVDEDTIRMALQSDGARPRDIADTLAEMKARKVAERHPTSLVIGCDQVLALGTDLFSKPESPGDARAQLCALSGKTHQLLSAVVVYENAQPVWRHVAEAELTMHPISDAYLDDYLQRNWDSIRHAVGCYKLEEEGVRLFSAIKGDYFTILGLPLLPLLAWLGTRGMIAR